MDRETGKVTDRYFKAGPETCLEFYLFTFGHNPLRMLAPVCNVSNAVTGKTKCTKAAVIMFCVVALLGNPFHSFSQDQDHPYSRSELIKRELKTRKINIVKTDILSYLIGTYTVSYERLALTAPRSFVATLEYRYYSLDNVTYSGPAFRPGLRYYFSKKKQPPAGLYTDLLFSYATYKVYDSNQQLGARDSQIGGGLEFGKQWAIGGRLTIDFFLGALYIKNTFTSGLRIESVPEIRILLGAKTGFRF